MKKGTGCLYTWKNEGYYNRKIYNYINEIIRFSIDRERLIKWISDDHGNVLALSIPLKSGLGVRNQVIGRIDTVNKGYKGPRNRPDEYQEMNEKEFENLYTSL